MQYEYIGDISLSVDGTQYGGDEKDYISLGMHLR